CSDAVPQNTSGTASTTPTTSTATPASARTRNSMCGICRRARAVTSAQRDDAVGRPRHGRAVGPVEPARVAREAPADLDALAALEPLVALDRAAELLQVPAGGLGRARLRRAGRAEPADRRHLVGVDARPVELGPERRDDLALVGEVDVGGQQPVDQERARALWTHVRRPVAGVRAQGGEEAL